jgi:hypothetical protein
MMPMKYSDVWTVLRSLALKNGNGHAVIVSVILRGQQTMLMENINMNVIWIKAMKGHINVTAERKANGD